MSSTTQNRGIYSITHRSLDRRLVDALRLVDVVGAAVRLDGAAPGGARGRVVRAVRLDDVVLDQRAFCPPVDREVAVDVGSVPGTVIRDDSRRPRVPSLSGDKVANIGPGHVVRTPSAVVVVH